MTFEARRGWLLDALQVCFLAVKLEEDKMWWLKYNGCSQLSQNGLNLLLGARLVYLN